MVCFMECWQVKCNALCLERQIGKLLRALVMSTIEGVTGNGAK